MTTKSIVPPMPRCILLRLSRSSVNSRPRKKSRKMIAQLGDELGHLDGSMKRQRLGLVRAEQEPGQEVRRDGGKAEAARQEAEHGEDGNRHGQLAESQRCPSVGVRASYARERCGVVRSPVMADGSVPDRNLALELVRVTEAAALGCGRWIGRGDKNAADQAAVDAMRAMLDTVSMSGVVVIGEGEKDEAPMLYNGEEVGNGRCLRWTWPSTRSRAPGSRRSASRTRSP